MANWKRVAFDKAVQINPTTKLLRGETYPFVEMHAVNPSSRDVGPSEYRAFTGGGARFITGDTLMARITPCLENGKIARFRGTTQETVAHGSTEFIVIRGKDGVTNNDFAYYLTRSEIVRGFAISQMTGTSGRQRVPTEALSHLQVALPPLDEQQVISKTLGSLDDKIELNWRMNETLEATAKALFESWFIANQRRDSWQENKFESIASLGREALNPGKFPEEFFNHYSIPSFDERRLPSIQGGDVIKSNKFIVPIICVLISKLNPRIPRVWLPYIEQNRRPVCSTEFLVAVPREGVPREWIYALLSSADFLERFASLVTGTSGSHQRVKPESLLGMIVRIPPKSMMSRFAAIAGPIYSKVAHNLIQAQSAASARDALLPKLLSGELSVRQAERAVGISA